MRIYDVETVNAIAHRIADRLGGDFDFSAPIADRKNIFLHDGGVAACIWSAPRVFECHLLYPPEHRGRAAVQSSIRMGDYMLKHHADMLWGRPPESDKAAMWHIRNSGFVEYGRGLDATLGPVVYFWRRVCRP